MGGYSVKARALKAGAHQGERIEAVVVSMRPKWEKMGSPSVKLISAAAV